MRKKHEDADQKLAFFIAETEKRNASLQRFHEIAHHLNRHMWFEENAIFISFARFTGLKMGKGFLALMARDHTVIRNLIKETKKACEDKKTKRCLFFAKHLQQALRAHLARENAAVYPVSDLARPPDEEKELLEDLSH